MASRNKQHHRFNDPKDSNFDLDEYLEEKGAYSDNTQPPLENEHESERSFFRNGVLVAAVILSGFLWYFDWSPRAAYNAIFGDSGTEVVSTSPVVVNIPPINVEIPDINIDNIPEFRFNTQSEDLGSITDYLLELREKGLLNDDMLSAFSARQLYEGGVPISYIEELSSFGYLQRFSFVQITEFYQNQIPNSYLYQLDQVGYLDRFSFVEITEYYQNDVSFEYLNTLDEAGYLNELSFVHITEYYNNGVTVEFLDELKESGLYNSLSFIDVVEIFKNEN